MNYKHDGGNKTKKKIQGWKDKAKEIMQKSG